MITDIYIYIYVYMYLDTVYIVYLLYIIRLKYVSTCYQVVWVQQFNMGDPKICDNSDEFTPGNCWKIFDAVYIAGES